ncbi:unnamed protein product [Echinostoma caproni]|uniref:Alpha-galactosidase n=1 Tax=Echinostoma caproni TaxID=27848 RepID=A0A183ABG7_9TREM|nr:unnamed protein product [Echinostoma caproni]
MSVALLHWTLWFGLSATVYGLDNGLALKPPMGWMTWQRYRCQIDCSAYPRDCISDSLIRRNAKRLVEDGFREVGYEYVIIDDCWPMKFRDRHTSELVPDPQRFPSGMKAIADFLHENNLKFGIYLDYGTFTCEHYPGSMDYLELDAKTVAKFEADYVKMDGCFAPLDKMAPGYEEFAKQLNKTGRPILFSCSYPAYIGWQMNHSLIDWQQLQKNCNMWRMLFDVDDRWDNVQLIINKYVEQSELLAPLAGPGHWNDPDMLVLGNFGLSRDQERVQMGLWCMFAAPLIMSTEMDELNEESAKLLKNKMLISIDQDEGGHQAKFLGRKGSVQLWMRPLTSIPNSWAIALFNTKQGGGPIHLPITLKEMGIPSSNPDTDLFELIDVFTEDDFGVLLQTESVIMRINPTGIVMYLVKLRAG